VALYRALAGVVERGLIAAMPLRDSVAAVSVGVVGEEALLDLSYPEDSVAASDMNVVMTGSGRLVEVQASAEGQTFLRRELDALLDLAEGGIAELAEAQRAALADLPALAFAPGPG
jgi:ribonuclease PH